MARKQNMRILVVHNGYQKHGGEDVVVEAEERLLRAHGHSVVRYRRHNEELRGRGPLDILTAGMQTVWSKASAREVAALLAKEKPGVVHFHNIFPLISPAAYYACEEAGVPVVQTLHNYRLLCPGAYFLRDGRVCEECLGRSVPWPGVVHGCYRESRAATAAVATMIAVHRGMNTWREKVGVYIALSEFARKKFIEGGLPGERIVVKPNFVDPDPGLKCGAGEYALYVGRLSVEKGLRVLLGAWGQLRGRIPLRIAGDGPLKEEIAAEIKTRGLSGVDLLGRLAPSEIVALMQGARFLVLPSVCYENFPLAVAEAFACGLPVIASRLGSMAEIVADGDTGLHVTPGDSAELAAKVDWAWRNPGKLQELGKAGRQEYVSKYGPEQNYKRLIGIFERAIEGKS
jgi:glycosyltransferase involved in cell wall biosynthesis